VPTIALLLGVPIPFSSIGSIIENVSLLIMHKKYSSKFQLFTERQLSIALKLNCLQLLRYASGVAKHDSSVQVRVTNVGTSKFCS
jgi:hypothetical protein